MDRHQHPSNNDVLGAPPGVAIEDCSALPITRTYDEAGREVVASYWKPSPEEIEAIVAGRPVVLIVWGRTHPPLIVAVDAS